MAGKRKILIVDDDIRLSHTVQMLLDREGRFETRVENSALRARQTAREFLPDLIVLDVIMPDKDGGAVAAEIREDALLARVPVIFLTSIVDRNEAAVRGSRLGNDPVLAKPVTIAELLAQIEKSLARR
jgi:DNA-binding response OmpR family regulator